MYCMHRHVPSAVQLRKDTASTKLITVIIIHNAVYSTTVSAVCSIIVAVQFHPDHITCPDVKSYDMILCYNLTVEQLLAQI